MSVGPICLREPTQNHVCMPWRLQHVHAASTSKPIVPIGIFALAFDYILRAAVHVYTRPSARVSLLGRYHKRVEGVAYGRAPRRASGHASARYFFASRDRRCARSTSPPKSLS